SVATHERLLPVGTHPRQLYSLGTPNGQMLPVTPEELLPLGVTGAEYAPWMIRIVGGERFASGLIPMHPNAMIPALRAASPSPTTLGLGLTPLYSPLVSP
ncbi:hypothetical protein CSC88_36495, partial [Klebsiella pneumoniae]